MIVDSCEWAEPGRDPYHGTAEAAIRAMEPLDRALRDVLLEHVRDLGSYDDVVIVSRDAIRGRAHDYESDLIWLNSGDGRRVCAIARRDTWAPDHVETAIAFCAASVCVVKFSVCGNWAIVTIRSQPPRPEETPPAAVQLPPELAVPPAVPDAPIQALPPSEVELPPAELVGYPQWGYPPAYYYPPIGPCCAFVPPPIPPPVPAVAEPPAWLLFLASAGLLPLIGRRNSTRRKSATHDGGTHGEQDTRASAPQPDC